MPHVPVAIVSEGDATLAIKAGSGDKFRVSKGVVGQIGRDAGPEFRGDGKNFHHPLGNLRPVLGVCFASLHFWVRK